MATQTNTVRFGRQSTRGIILGFSWSRALALGAAGLLLTVGLFGFGAMGAAATSIIWLPLVLSAFVRLGGRPAVEWSSTALEYGARIQAKQTTYIATLPVAPRPAGTMALPGDGAALRFYIDDETGTAMVHDPHHNTISATVAVSHEAFVLLDDDERNSRVATWGRLLASLAQSGTTSQIQVCESTVPDPARGQSEWFAEHGSHDGGWADREYTALLEQAKLSSGTHRTTITLTLDLQAARKAVKAAGRGMKGSATVLRGDMAQLTDSLRQCSIRAGNWLSEAELSTILRQAYDPAFSLDPRSDPGANLTHAGPLAVSEHWDHLRHTGAYSSVLWVSEWPRIQVRPDFLHHVVFTQGVRRTLSLIAHPLPTDLALRQIRKEKTEAITDSRQKAKVGQIADLSDRQEFSDIEAREQSIVQGHTDVEFSGFILVTAGSPEALDQARSQVAKAATQGACEVRPLYGRQLQGMLLTLPLGRRAF